MKKENSKGLEQNLSLMQTISGLTSLSARINDMCGRTRLSVFRNGIRMQETANKQKRMADEMDFNLEVFNLETDFFGDLHCSSRFTDMLCDAQAQYGDYSELEKCPMWGMWVKEGGGEIKALRKIVGSGG